MSVLKLVKTFFSLKNRKIHKVVLRNLYYNSVDVL